MTSVFNTFIPQIFLRFPTQIHSGVSADSYKYFIFSCCVNNKFLNIEFAIKYILSTHATLLKLTIVLYFLNF